jgi:hypothetical protein
VGWALGIQALGILRFLLTILVNTLMRKRQPADALSPSSVTRRLVPVSSCRLEEHGEVPADVLQPNQH